MLLLATTRPRDSKLEYLAVYGRASMGVSVGELQSTMAPTTDYCLSHLYGDGASDTFFCHGQKRDYLSRASLAARGATKKSTTAAAPGEHVDIQRDGSERRERHARYALKCD